MKERPQTMIGRRGEGLGRGPGALSGQRQGLEAVAKGIGEGVAPRADWLSWRAPGGWIASLRF